MAEKKCSLQFAVLGLGRFGLSLVKTLAEYDVNLLACDKQAGPLHEASEYATHVVQADVTDPEAMDRIGLGNFDVAVIAISEDFEAAVMAVLGAKELGVGRIVAKASGERQKKILMSVGADTVVLPEVEMGEKVARNLVQPNVMDALSNLGKFSVLEQKPLPEWVGKTLRESEIRKDYGTHILAVIREGKTIVPVPPSLALETDDVLISLEESRKA